jgi:hypothetical protein
MGFRPVDDIKGSAETVFVTVSIGADSDEVTMGSGLMLSRLIILRITSLKMVVFTGNEKGCKVHDKRDHNASDKRQTDNLKTQAGDDWADHGFFTLVSRYS